MQQLKERLEASEAEQLRQRSEMQDRIQHQFQAAEQRMHQIEAALETLAGQGTSNSQALTQVTADVAKVNETMQRLEQLMLARVNSTESDADAVVKKKK